MSTTTLQIIQDYVKRVRQSVTLLQDRFGEHDLLRGVRGRTIPKRGLLDDDAVTFSFHGIGCRIEAKLGSKARAEPPPVVLGDRLWLTIYPQAICNCSITPWSLSWR